MALGALLALVVGACLGPIVAQDTGGPFKGSVGDLAGGQCVDNRGHTIPEGRLFEPGPDECQVCTCLRKLPVLCRTVLCAPPQGCRTLRVGEACCEWICDEWETGPGSQVSDLGLRLVASAVTAVLSLSLLFFLIYRLRQRRLRGRQNHLEAESYGGRSLEELPLPNLQGLKPEERATLCRPFPPSYNEAMFGSTNSTVTLEEEEVAAPPYSSIQQDPVICYPLATLGRLVLPPVEQRGERRRREQEEREEQEEQRRKKEEREEQRMGEERLHEGMEQVVEEEEEDSKRNGSRAEDDRTGVRRREREESSPQGEGEGGGREVGRRREEQGEEEGEEIMQTTV